MKIQLVRNATLKIWFGGKCFLMDPYFAPKHSQPSLAGKSLNPLVDLPFPAEDILRDVDAVVVSHLHPDHFDDCAQHLIPKQTTVFCQPSDETSIRQLGFSNVKCIANNARLGEVLLHRVEGKHGKGAIESLMGSVSGFVFQHQQEKTLYWAGDTIWCEPVQQAIFEFNPVWIVCHAGGNRFFEEHPVFGEAFQGGSDAVIMDVAQVIDLAYYALNSKIIATHLGALDHETVTRAQLRQLSQQAGITPHRLLIPHDGETLLL